jgi:propionyl-CoA carboxylase beta chain
MRDRTEELRQRRAAVLAGGGERRIAAQHAKGKLTARERLGLLYERDSFQ